MQVFNLEPYIELAEGFLNGRTDAETFVSRYFELYLVQDETTMWPEAHFRVLDRLFVDADAFSPHLDRGPHSIDEQELRHCVEQALSSLKELQRTCTDEA